MIGIIKLNGLTQEVRWTSSAENFPTKTSRARRDTLAARRVYGSMGAKPSRSPRPTPKIGIFYRGTTINFIGVVRSM